MILMCNINNIINVCNIININNDIISNDIINVYYY